MSRIGILKHTIYSTKRFFPKRHLISPELNQLQIRDTFYSHQTYHPKN